MEDLSVNRMVHNHCLAKSISDAAWAAFAAMLSFKAAWAGRSFIAVNPAYTSQDCSRCGHRQKMPLTERVFRCPCCGLELDRDHNAALNVLYLGLQAVGLHGAGLAGERLWAVEDCRQLTRWLERRLLAVGGQLVRVPPKLTVPERRAGRTRGKSDAIDALAVARAALREPDRQ